MMKTDRCMAVAFLLLAIWILQACESQVNLTTVPRVENGLLDLRNWDFGKAGPVALDGEWEFYWQAHLTPEDFSRAAPPIAAGLITVPGIWNGYEINGEKIPGRGFATYRMRILLGESPPALAFKFLDMAVAYSVYVNEELLTSVGMPGKTFQTTAPRFHPKVVEYVPRSGQLELIIHISNFHHRKGGAWESILLGAKDDIWQKRRTAVHLNLFLTGGILIMGIYHVGLFVFRTPDKSALFFGIFCFLIAIRILVTGERYLIELLPDFNWEIHTKIAYLSYYLAVPTFAVYARNIFPGEISKYAINAILIVGALFSAVVLLTPAVIYSVTAPLFQIFTLMAFCYGLYILLLALFRRRQGARLFLFGFLALFLTGVNDILYSHLIFETGYMIQFGISVFIFSQALLLSLLFSKTFKTVESQRLALEDTNRAYKNEIMERRRTGDALRESEEKYRQLVENANEAIIVAQDGMLQFVNKRATELSGYSEEELKAAPFIDRVHPDDRDMVRQNYQKRISGGHAPANYTVRCIHHDGSIRWADVSSVRISWEGSPATLTFLSDRTDRRRLEEELLKAQKLESIGVLAGGIAHDFNNILSSIMGNISLARIHLASKNDKAGNFLEKAETASKRATGLTQQLLTFSKGGAPVKRVTSISGVIKECATFILSGSKVRCDFNLPKDLWPVEIDEAQISQVLQNIVINADQAMPDGGVIQINAENIKVAANQGLPLEDGQHVRIAIRDCGDGIRQDHLDKIFDPYFTTKPDGSGLGLATAYTIMERHSGHIGVKSQVGVETVFTLYLPASDQEPPATADGIAGAQLSRGRILAMDDEDMIRDLIDHMLRHIGFDVVTASTGEEAIQLYRLGLEAGKPFDLVILDLTVPGAMGGKEALEKLREIDPAVNAVVSSGYSNDPIMADFRSYGFKGVVVKPFSVQNLGDTLSRILT